MHPLNSYVKSLLTYVNLATFSIYLWEILAFNRVYYGALSVDRLISNFHFDSLFMLSVAMLRT